MNFRGVHYLSVLFLTAVMVVGEAFAYTGRLSPSDFNKMYYLATQGKVAILREAVNRGLNIDSVNYEGDTGLCIAIKRKNYTAYNSFRLSGANLKHTCVYKIAEEYKEFLASNKSVHAQYVVGNGESLYYSEDEKSWWPWILGGAIGGGVLAFSGGGGNTYVPPVDDTIAPINPGYGLGMLMQNTKNEVDGEGFENSVARVVNSLSSDAEINTIALLPNVLDNADKLLSYAKVSGDGYFDNLKGGSLHLSNATVGVNVYGKDAKAFNNGNIEIEARNGSIGMVASNGGQIINGSDEADDTYGNIDISFKGDKEGYAVIGMYGDTGAKIVNKGKITGTTSAVDIVEGEEVVEEEEGIGDGFVVEEVEGTSQTNSGTILGMALFDLYTGTNLSANTVTADNYGDIVLSAGYNSATDVAVSLIGMGSYIDGQFLDGKNNPAFAEKMNLNNEGNINIKYQGAYKLADEALKLGKGGLIGIRADAATTATNKGNISVDLTSTSMDAEKDVAAGMLSVHGAELVNGNKDEVFDGSQAIATGVVRVINEANSGGVSYGMLAAKGEGSQTRIYNWQDPKLYNYGLVDMQASNSYALASFAGGEVVNYGVVNLGVEKGQSRYKNNFGLYAAGDDDTKEIILTNKGIINVYSEESTALYNAFSGSVEMINDGVIYLSNKATKSEVFGGNFSSAYNNGSILYKVGNSEGFTKPVGVKGTPGFNVKGDIVAGVVSVSNNDDASKQLFVNEGNLKIGEAYDKKVDYGGTYGTAGVWISKQGSAINNEQIKLEKFDKDYSQFNVGMYLDSTSTSEAYADNYGDIVVDATNSVGIRNDSVNGASATNFGSIYANGDYVYGMAVTGESGTIFNGRSIAPADSINAIYVGGRDSVGMYAKDGTAYNYGSIYLQGDGATAFLLDGKTAKLAEEGNIYHNPVYDGITYFWVANGAQYTLSYPGGLEVEGFTLGKATDGGILNTSGDSTIYVKGNDAYLFKADGSGSIVNNRGSVIATAGATPIIVTGGATGQNSGYVSVTGGNGHALYASGEGSKVENTYNAVIDVDGGTGLYAVGLSSAYNYASINVTEGTGMYVSGKTIEASTEGKNLGAISVSGQGNIGVKVESGASFENSGTIDVVCDDCSEGGYAYGIYAYGQGENAINTSDGTILVGNNAIGMVGGVNEGGISVASNAQYGISGGVNNGKVYGKGVLLNNTNNTGEVNASTGVGINVDSGYSVTNSGTVVVGSGNGAYVKGSFSNEGEISVGNGNGVYVDGGSATNSGTIILSGSGYGAYVNSGSFVNSGTIVYDSRNGGSCANIGVGGECTDEGKEDEEETETETTAYKIKDLIYLEDGATFVNKGIVDLDKVDIDFDVMTDGGNNEVVIAKGGTFKADSFKGNVIASKDIVIGGFEDVYVNKNSFEGKNDGLEIGSDSYMFDANLLENDETIDVELNRKKFEEIVEDKDVAEFLETNYVLKNNEKMYNALKGASTQDEFNYAEEVETGKNFYANLARENMAVLRGINTLEQNRILADGMSGGYIGVDYYRIGKDAYNGLSGFSDDVYSPYIGYGERLNSNWSMGGTLRATYADAEYDEANSSRDNKILMAMMPILYKNGGFKFLTMPSVGGGYGTYRRQALSGKYDADTLDFYYGLYNHAEYSVDMKVAELVAEAELNMQGVYMSEAEENEGLNLDSNSSVSVETGVGIKLRKRFELAKERSLMVALGAKYYHELADPYRDLRVGMDGSPVGYEVKAYEEDDNRFKTTAEVVYKDGNFAMQAEISHNVERENSVEGGMGIRYNF